MKKKVILFLIASITTSIISYKASAQSWLITGNNNTTALSKLGTTNFIPLNLVTNNATRIRIDENGLVGVGTTTPVTKLHVNGFGSFGNRVTAGNATRALNLCDTSAVMRVLRVHPTFAPAVELISRTTADGANVSYWDFYTQPSDASFRIRDRKFSGAGLDRLTITHGGLVGIGTTAPAYKLHVEAPGTAIYGNSTSGLYGVWGNSTYLGVYGTGTSYGVYANASDAAGYGVVGYGGGYGVYGSSTNSGYGLYGLSSSSYSANGSTGVYGSAYYGVHGVGTYGLWGEGSYIGAYGYAPSGSYGTFGYSNYIGAYGSGTNYGVYGYTPGGSGSDPNGLSGVYGYNASTGYGVGGHGVSGSGVYGYSDNYVGVWGSTGNSSSWAGYFAGNVYSSGTYQGSDKKLKQNITDVSDAMDIINKLKPKSYDFRHDGNYKLMNLPAGKHYGLIAQEVEAVLPNLLADAHFDTRMAQAGEKGLSAMVKEKPAAANNKYEVIDYKALNYTELIPIIVKGMQEQQAKITKQDQQIQELITANENLVNQLNEIKALIKGNSITSSSLSGYLKQNIPNPSTNSTVISYYLPSNVGRGEIKIMDIKGSCLKTYPASSGASQLTIMNGELPAGTYTYGLYTNNRLIDSKKMIIGR